MSAEWDNVTVIRKKAQTAKATKSTSAVNSALRSGGAVITEKKIAGNKAPTDHQRIAKLDRETEELSHETVSLDLAKAIQQARQAKGLTQKELAVKINEKANIINEYEGGKAIPSQMILGKLERALMTKLRGKDIGQPLTFGKKK